MGLILTAAAMGPQASEGGPLQRARRPDFPARPEPGLFSRHNPFAPLAIPFPPPASRETSGMSLPQGRMTVDALKRRLEERGFSGVSNARPLGENTLMQAVGPAGQRLTIVLNATTGEIVGLRLRGR